jgi:hypothetical protein
MSDFVQKKTSNHVRSQMPRRRLYGIPKRGRWILKTIRINGMTELIDCDIPSSSRSWRQSLAELKRHAKRLQELARITESLADGSSAPSLTFNEEPWPMDLGLPEDEPFDLARDFDDLK